MRRAYGCDGFKRLVLKANMEFVNRKNHRGSSVKHSDVTCFRSWFGLSDREVMRRVWEEMKPQGDPKGVGIRRLSGHVDNQGQEVQQARSEYTREEEPTHIMKSWLKEIFEC